MSTLQVVCVTSVDESKDEGSKGKVEEVCLMALVEIRKACSSVKANFEVILLESLDFHGSSNFYPFYDADVAIVDMSSRDHRSSLIYHIGIRESVGKMHTIITLFDSNPEFTLSVRLSRCSADFLSYKADRTGKGLTAHFTGPSLSESEEKNGSVCQFVRRILKSVACNSKVHAKEQFLQELKKMRDSLKGDDLRGALVQMKSRLFDPDLYSSEIILNMLLLYRDAQDYNSMVEMVEDMEAVPSNHITQTVTIQHLYAFALNRRNSAGDRDRSLRCILKAIEMSGSEIPDLLCLCGRIYKDKYVESQLKEQDALQEAIKWYGRGYEAEANIYAGINLATLLVISGEDFNTSPGLQKITRTLISLIGRKGSLKSLTDYWDVATFFEVCVLRQEYARATQAAECMYKLDPPVWYLKSTLGNIQLINSSSKETDKEPKPETEVFTFWMDLFSEAIKESTTDIRFPVLILEPNQVLQASYLQLNEDGYDPSIRLWHVGMDTSGHMSEWVFTPGSIKGVSKCNHKALFLYVYDNADDFHLFFPTHFLRDKVHDCIVAMVTDSSRDTDVMMDADVSLPVIKYEYEYDEWGSKLLLGRGRFGVVYAAFNSETQVKIAVKEVPEMNKNEVQALHGEVAMLCRLHHHNIVNYLGSLSEEGCLKLFMERIPGGSLSSLLRHKWGPLKGNETTIVIYTLQIVKGLNYLHENGIVHRDLKGCNVLVNTYSGSLKISDFSISRRLRIINPSRHATTTPTPTATASYPTPDEEEEDEDDNAAADGFPAPEVVQKGLRGYGFPADVWSLGCTVIEMATGEPPKRPLTSPAPPTPVIPPELSSNAADFLNCCFVLDDKLRPSAYQLLHHSFIHESHKKKSPQTPSSLNKAQDINRSLSVPVSSLLPSPGSPKAVRRKTQVLSLSQVEESPGVQAPFNTLSHFHHVLSPNHPTTHRPHLTLPDSPRMRPRSEIFAIKEFPTLRSINSVFSSDTSLATCDSGLASEDSFYTLKKDSERKLTLVKVLTEDQEEICDKWLRRLQLKPTQPSSHQLNREHLKRLLQGMRDFVNDGDVQQLKHVINLLNEEVHFEAKARTEMLLAAYIFQEIVSDVLKAHNIEPHWMFALDIIIRSTTRQVISIISPELGQSFRENEDSGVHVDDDVTSSSIGEVATRMKTQKRQDLLMEENSFLMRSLIKSQLLNKEMLNRNITSTNMHAQIVKELMACNISKQQCLQQPTVQLEVSMRHNDEVRDWLRQIHVTQASVDKVLQEQFELHHLLHVVTRQDLEALNVKCGDLYRMWESIEKYRKQKGLS